MDTKTHLKFQNQKKYIYHFDTHQIDGSIKDRHLLGNKGANLAEMSLLGLQVPPGFTLSAELCHLFLNEKKNLKDLIEKPLEESVKRLEKLTGKQFNGVCPLLLSVRSGAVSSLPGMMDTILNLGLNEKTVHTLAKIYKNERFAWDNYRRFIQMYSSVVMKMNSSLLDVYLEDYKKKYNYLADSEISAEDWKKIVPYFKEAILQNTGKVFPEDPWEQLWSSIEAVFNSWNNPRAVVYREMNGVNSFEGTAVNIQVMVFGNRGKDSATGVVFTRDPSTGEKKLFGEFLQNAQGEDVVSGMRTPLLIVNEESKEKDLKTLMPESFEQLKQLCDKLEKHYKYVQDIEFTIEQNKLWLLQTRNAKCNPKAQLKILFDFMEEGILTEEEVLEKVDTSFLNTLLHPSIDKKNKNTVLAKGLPASPGAAVGRIAFDGESVLKFHKKSIPAILVRCETSPEDIKAMIHSKGVLTLKGGMTSHAAVVARNMGKPCIVGCESAFIDEHKKELHFASKRMKQGDFITLDGSTGDVLLGSVKMKATCLDSLFFKLMDLSDKYKGLTVRANADTPCDVKKAKEFGAKGLGLCRTEHMFFEENRINIMRKMILSESTEERHKTLNELFVMQEKDFYEIFKIMSPHSITVRLLDPPLHEFLPQKEKDILALSQKLDLDKDKLTFKIQNLSEVNPMLGHRGCRLAITFPEIYLMQTKAIISAMRRILEEDKEQKMQIEIMIPLVCEVKELKFLKSLIEKEIKKSEDKIGVSLNILVGTMIELPRACLIADHLAQNGDFFSFGTNDLTQTVFGFSRDDIGQFLPIYTGKNILQRDPFSHLDIQGVGELMKIAVKKARAVKKNIKLGVCGEQGGDSQSIPFFHGLNLDYISCSPYRVPIARLVSAQCNIKEKRK
ncbi:MAG: pyruvate, phosphate dikinase [Bdellovibrionales bacterium]|nr:pyruvate, phosphate dikinase [Bdellovibrionales bacterium]